MKKVFTTLLLIMVAMTTWAYDAEVDGIYYNLVSKAKTAVVTYKGATYSEAKSYSGNVEIPETIEVEGVTYSVTSIGEWAFGDCSGLTSVTIPNSVTSIGEHAFSYCSGLTSVNITDLTAWCKIQFSKNSGNPLCYAHHLYLNGEEVKNLTIPKSVTSIGNYAFYYCSGLTSVTIGNSVTSIGDDAFWGCSGLTSVTILNSVTSIGNYAFAYCSGLTSVTIPNSVTSIGIWAFYGCSGLTSVTIPNSVTNIEYAAFEDCTGLTSVTIPNSVTSIGSQAFYDCTGLKTVSIGTGIKSISQQAFASCKNMETVTCYAEAVPSMGTDVFKDSYVGYATLKVPDASVDLYKAADQWKEFGTIQGINGGVPTTQKCATPTIAFENNKLIYSTETEGAEVISTVTVADAKTSYDLEVSLTATYNITAYATKTGYDNSDVATATLVWATGSLDPTTPAKEISVDAQPLLITQNGGVVTVSGASDGETVSAYTVGGTSVAAAKAVNKAVTLDLSSIAGQIAVLKVGNKTAKVIVK